MFLILTVQPLTNKNGTYRLGLSKNDFENVTQKLKKKEIFILLPGKEKALINYKTFAKHHNLINTAISEWIIEKGYAHKESRKPFRFIFEFKRNEFVYYKYQAN